MNQLDSNRLDLRKYPDLQEGAHQLQSCKWKPKGLEMRHLDESKNEEDWITTGYKIEQLSAIFNVFRRKANDYSNVTGNGRAPLE